MIYACKYALTINCMLNVFVFLGGLLRGFTFNLIFTAKTQKKEEKKPAAANSTTHVKHQFSFLLT